MVPPFCDVNLMALFMRLDIAWVILPLSASTNTSADMIILSGNPVDNISNTKKIEAVINNGQLN
jgi:hypothetical protein